MCGKGADAVTGGAWRCDLAGCYPAAVAIFGGTDQRMIIRTIKYVYLVSEQQLPVSRAFNAAQKIDYWRVNAARFVHLYKRRLRRDASVGHDCAKSGIA
jgi:hypothetical protein